MKRWTAWLLAAGLILGASAPALAAGAEDDVSIAFCGHMEEMLKARQALVDGDRQEALEHLREARRILEQCESEGPAQAVDFRSLDQDQI